MSPFSQIEEMNRPLILTAHLVSHLGNHSQLPGRTHLLCRPQLLRGLVELGHLGRVRTRLEPPRPHVPATARLSQLHLGHEGQQAHGDAHHVLPVGLRARASHVVHLQEVARVSATPTDVPGAPSSAEPHKVSPEPPNAGQRHLLGWYFYRANSAVQPVFDSVNLGVVVLLRPSLHTSVFSSLCFILYPGIGVARV